MSCHPWFFGRYLAGLVRRTKRFHLGDRRHIDVEDDGVDSPCALYELLSATTAGRPMW
jgi:hypothetical protein